MFKQRYSQGNPIVLTETYANHHVYICWRFEFNQIIIDMENTIQDIDHQIQIAQQELAFEKDSEAKKRYQVKLKKLQLQREIAVIKKRIQQLS